MRRADKPHIMKVGSHWVCYGANPMWTGIAMTPRGAWLSWARAGGFDYAL